MAFCRRSYKAIKILLWISKHVISISITFSDAFYISVIQQNSTFSDNVEMKLFRTREHNCPVIIATKWCFSIAYLQWMNRKMSFLVYGMHNEESWALQRTQKTIAIWWWKPFASVAVLACGRFAAQRNIWNPTESYFQGETTIKERKSFVSGNLSGLISSVIDSTIHETIGMPCSRGYDKFESQIKCTLHFQQYIED